MFNEPKNAEPLTEEQQLTRLRVFRAMNRRRFMATMGAAGLATAGSGLLTACSSDKSVPPASSGGGTVGAAAPSTTDVLNFALNLEYLEANFYAYATTGSSIPVANQGVAPGPITGGVQTTFGPTDALMQAVAVEIAADELTHVQLLQGAITAAGGTPVDQPALNLGAMGAFTTPQVFLGLARVFEDVGVSAYGGAAGYLSGTTLTTAAQILAVEAYHAGNIRYQYVAKAYAPQTPVDSADIPPDNTHFFDDTGALAVIRSTSQVLSIVYGGAATGASSGGFYPNGFNGNIKTI